MKGRERTVILCGNEFTSLPECLFTSPEEVAYKTTVILDRNPLGEAIANLGNRKLAPFRRFDLTEAGLTRVILENFGQIYLWQQDAD